MNKFKVEFFLSAGESTGYEMQTDLSFEELDTNIANALANAKFITIEKSETSVLSARCELVEKYRISIVKD